MSASSPDTRAAEILRRLCAAADAEASRALLPVVGCRILRYRPLFPDLSPADDEDLDGGIQSDWIDDQLYRCLPYQGELESLGDAGSSALQSAWPEGFQWVVFDDGSRDEEHARELIEPYLEWAEKLDLPLMTDFEATELEIEAHLTAEFVGMIRKWRDAVIKRIETARPQ